MNQDSAIEVSLKDSEAWVTYEVILYMYHGAKVAYSNNLSSIEANA